MERNRDYLSSMSREDLELYTLTLELKIQKQEIFSCNKDYKINKYKERAHTYKVEMERYRRKLTRIYELFDEVYQLAFMYAVMGKIPYIVYKKVKDFIKEIKNV